MKTNTDHIQTTHTGSLPRPEYVLSDLLDREQGKEVNDQAFERHVREAIDEVVGQQRDAGIDLVNDGEAGKPSYVVYVKYRLAGFEGEDIIPPAPPSDGRRTSRNSSIVATTGGARSLDRPVTVRSS